MTRNILLSALIAAGLAVAPLAATAYAGDMNMNKMDKMDNMSGGSMTKDDGMSKSTMSDDAMKKDGGMNKSSMSGGNMSNDDMKK